MTFTRVDCIFVILILKKVLQGIQKLFIQIFFTLFWLAGEKLII